MTADARVRFPSITLVVDLKKGQVAERSKAAVLKTAGPKGSVGSNPTLSVIR